MASIDFKNMLVINELTETQLNEMKNNGTVPKNETFYTPEEDINIILHDTTGQDAEGLMTQKAITDALEERVLKITTINNKPLTGNISLSASDVGALSKSGDTLGGPLKVTGGDSSTAGKIILDEANKGQITNNSTGTLFGFTNTTDLTVGHSGYNLLTRGKATRPKYNGNDLALKSDVPTLPTLSTVATSGSYNDLTNKPTLSTVATSGSYNDLINKPTIPTQITVDSALSSTSTNPVQNKVVNSALGGKQETLVSGTNIKTFNGVSLLGSGNIAKPEYDYSEIKNTPTIPEGAKLYSTTGQNTDGGMTQKAVTDALGGKQATLVSGTNIKTVGGESLVGSGNIKIMEHWWYSTNMPETAAAGSEQWIYADPGSIKIVYYNFNATTNSKSLTVKDNDTGQRIAYMANINGYNQYHLATIVIPSGKCYYFYTTIAAQYSVVALYV